MSRTHITSIGVIGTALLLGTSVPSANAQAPIRVTVNRDLINFAGQQPVQKFGNVLVPLRGVFEKLGASVQYDPVGKSILATKGQTTVSLQLGASQAQVNGQLRALAVPAQATLGTTLVPLRFVSEALGADVKWEAASRTVLISTDGAGLGDTPTNAGDGGSSGGGAAEVRSFVLDGAAAERPLRAGETLTVTLEGTAGASKATFSIPGVKTAQNLPLRETSPGVYTGTFTIPNGADIKAGAVLASLTARGVAAPVIQARQTLRVDAAGPTIASVTPLSKAQLPPGKPLIYGTFSDSGTGIDTAATRLLVNGKEVADATITESFFSYRPTADLPVGRNTATIVVRDAAGNETKRDWEFTIISEVSPIKSLKVTPEGKTFEAGDVIAVRLEAAPGGSARFNIGASVVNRPLSEESPGIYSGSYTIRKGDSLTKAPISVAYKTAAGRTVTQEAEQSITIAAGAPNAPTITTPAADAKVGDSVTITGKAAPGATVRVTVAFEGTLIIVPTQGTVTTEDVIANAQGIWSLPALKLETPLGVRNLRYTVSAASLGAAGETSEATTVNFRK